MKLKVTQRIDNEDNTFYMHNIVNLEIVEGLNCEHKWSGDLKHLTCTKCGAQLMDRDLLKTNE